MRISTSSMSIEAPLAAVWAAVTSPEYVKQWQYGSALMTDWMVGSPIRFTSEWEGRTFEQWGTVLRVDEPTHLSYSLFAPRPGVDDLPENYFVMRYDLVERDGATMVTFTHEDPRESGFVPGDDDHHENPILLALKAVAESIPNDELDE
jgi:uncharacterized protein YndB with AHSA1/START domain